MPFSPLQPLGSAVAWGQLWMIHQYQNEPVYGTSFRFSNSLEVMILKEHDMLIQSKRYHHSALFAT